jgi:hypothetical protein
MPDYRCNMLDEHGNVLFPADVVAENLEAALRHAFDVLNRTNIPSSPSRRVYALEVWSGTSRLFSPEMGASIDAMSEEHVPAE